MDHTVHRLKPGEFFCSLCICSTVCRPFSIVARCNRRMSLRKWLIFIFAVSLVSLFYSMNRASKEMPQMKMRKQLIPHNFCPAENSSLPSFHPPDDLTYWGGKTNPNAARVLLISKNKFSYPLRYVSEFLVATRIKYKLTLTGKHLSDLLKLSKGAGKYYVIIFEDIRDFYRMDKSNRELLEKYCKLFKAGILGFMPSLEDYVEEERIKDLTKNKSVPITVTSHQYLTSVATLDHDMFRVLKPNQKIGDHLPGNTWTRLKAKSENIVPLLSASFLQSEDDELSEGKESLALLDTGSSDGIQKVIIGGGQSIKHWFIKLFLLDAMHYLSSGNISLPLTRYIMVDIDDVFVGVTRFTKDDVHALIESQERLDDLVPGFKYNLGFSGSTFGSGNKWETEGDEELVRRSNKFWWFPHMWKHIQPHRFDNISALLSRMEMNKNFAEEKHLPVSQMYSIAPHHSGVYPVHQQLYQAWRQIWNIRVTSTEEYPNLRPSRRRRGFVHEGISVLPRQTCGLYTKNLYYEEYPKGVQHLEDSIQGGELFMSIVTNPISIFMSHMPNYCCDRLAPYTFESVVSMIKCHTNLVLKTVPPLKLAKTYFKLFPDEVMPIWGNPCDDKRHLDIWSDSKTCSRLPKFLVIGPQKTGTTALYSFLQLHPSVQSNYPSKETFEEVQFFKGHDNYMKGIDWYMSNFPEVNDTKILFEKSATYFDGELVPQRVHRLLPKAHLVTIILPPGKRAYSWYQHMRAHNDPVAINYTFKEVIMAKSSSPKHLLSLQSRCLEPGKYAHHLEKWLMFFKPKKIHIIDGEELKYDPIAVMNRLQHLLDISPYADYKEKITFDRNKGFYCQLLGNSKTKCLGRGKGRKYPPLDEESQAWLTNYYKSSNEALEKMLSRLGYFIPSWLQNELGNEPDEGGSKI